MGSAVKKIAPIALAVGVGYATGGFGAAGGIGYSGSTSMMTTLAGKTAAGGGFFSGITGALSGNLISKAGLGLQAVSAISSRKYAKEGAAANRAQVDAQNKADAARNRYNNLLQKRQRLTEIRGARIRQGQVEGATAGSGLGAGGTSSFAGAVGATGTQASANLGNINVAEDVGNQITGLNTMAANYGSDANTAASKGGMWSQMNTLGSTLLTNQDEIKNIFGQG